jgi:hydrogenase-4 component F
VSEFLIFRSLFEGNHILLLVLVLLLLTIIIYAFGKNIMRILFIPANGFDDSAVQATSPWESLSQYLLLAAAVWLGLNPPDVFVRLIRDVVSILPN